MERETTNAVTGTTGRVFGSKWVGEIGELGPGWTVLRDMEGNPFEETKTEILSWFMAPATPRLVDAKRNAKSFGISYATMSTCR